MMLFLLTPQKVIRRIDAILVELASIDQRIKNQEENVDLALKLGLAKPGEDAAVREWRTMFNDIYEGMRAARFGILHGRESFLEINRHLHSVRASLRHFRKILTQTEKLEASGRAYAKKALR